MHAGPLEEYGKKVPKAARRGHTLLPLLNHNSGISPSPLLRSADEVKMSGLSTAEANRMVDASGNERRTTATQNGIPSPASSTGGEEKTHHDATSSVAHRVDGDEDNEKADVATGQGAHVAADGDAEQAIDDGSSLLMTKAEEKRLLRKVDWAIVPYCSLLYLLSFLDRVNIGQAAVAGLKADLGIATGNKYAIALSLFFVGYVVFEVPSNLALKALKPHRWIPFIMISWSIVMICMGLVQNGNGLIAARFFLGVVSMRQKSAPFLSPFAH